MMATFDIRRLAPGDEELAIRTIEAVKPAQERGPQPASPTHLARLLADEANVILVAMVGEAPAGYLIAYRLPRIDRDAVMVLLYEIAVAEEYRRRGIATAMINAMKRAFDQTVILKYWVLCPRPNRAAMRLYASTGGIPSTDADLVLYEYPGNAQAPGAGCAPTD